MKKIEWNDSYSVGDDELDKQHERLIAIINELIGKVDSECQQENFMQELLDMVTYSEDHFTFEEMKLSSVDYPDIESQIKDHRQYRSEVARIIESETKDFGQIMRFIIEWWMEHILVEDMKYKSYFS